MKLHFDFKLAHFRYEKIILKSDCTATVYGSSEALGGNGWFKIQGAEKLKSFDKKVLLKLDKENPELFLLYSGSTIFAVAKIPSYGSYNMENLDYFLVHEGTEDMNGFMNLESLDSYMDYWMNKYGPSPLD